jgi:hypothetical protein
MLLHRRRRGQATQIDPSGTEGYLPVFPRCTRTRANRTRERDMAVKALLLWVKSPSEEAGGER